VDHVLPTGEASQLGIPVSYSQDLINLVLCFSGYNGFNNRYTVPGVPKPQWEVDEFVSLRDSVFGERSQLIAARWEKEQAFFLSHPLGS
jgi:hypothetical protein